MGSVVSAIGAGINAIVSAIAGLIMAIIDAVVWVLLSIWDLFLCLICCRCGSRRRSSMSRSRGGWRRRGTATRY